MFGAKYYDCPFLVRIKTNGSLPRDARMASPGPPSMSAISAPPTSPYGTLQGPVNGGSGNVFRFDDAMAQHGSGDQYVNLPPSHRQTYPRSPRNRIKTIVGGQHPSNNSSVNSRCVRAFMNDSALFEIAH